MNATSVTAGSLTIQQLEVIVEHMTVSRYLLLAGFSVLIYDQFLTISEEVEFIWNRPKNLISWTFLLNRYFTPIILAIDAYDKLGFVKSLTSTYPTAHIYTLPSSCQTWVTAEVALHLLSSASIHGLVALRVSALWGDRPWIRFLLLGAWLVYVAFALSIGLAAVIQNRETFHPNAVLNSCVGVVGDFVFWVWVPPLILEVLLFGLTVAKAVAHSRRKIASMPIVYVLYRDGFNYFIVISLCSIFNLVVWRWAPLSFFALAKYFTLGIVNAMGARMVLNLRQLGGVRSNASPPTLYFVQAAPNGSGFIPEEGIESDAKQIWINDHELGSRRVSTDGPSIHPRPTPPSSQLSLSKPKRIKTKKADPYFYQRQASQLRALKVERPDFSVHLSEPELDPVHVGGGAFLGTAQIEETVATRSHTPGSAAARSHRTASIASSDFGERGPGKELYHMETWSVSTIALKDEQKTPKSDSLDSIGEGPSSPSQHDVHGRHPPWSYV